jgi:hypothetical protein
VAARIPLDVDLEDRLLYGLTPLRFGYLAVAGVAALMIWSAHGPPMALRIALALLVLGIGAGLAWARWHDRAIDDWLVDLAIFTFRNYQIEFQRPIRPRPSIRPARQPARDRPARPDPGRPLTVAVTAQQPGAGSRSIAVELAVTLAHQGDRVALVDHFKPPGVVPRLTSPLPAGLSIATPLDRTSGPDPDWTVRVLPPGEPVGMPDLAILISEDHATPAGANGWHRFKVVMNRGPGGNGCLPFDPELPAAQTAGTALGIRCPEAPFSQAIGRLAASIRQDLER